MLDIARNCVLSERWEHAMNILKCLETDVKAISSDEVFDLLAGRLKLVGDSDVGISIETEDPEERADVEKSQAYVYGGRFFHGGRWWRAYQTVQAGTEEDGHWAYSNLDRCRGRILTADGMRAMGPTGPMPQDVNGGTPKHWPFARPLMYANDPYSDLLVWVGSKGEQKYIAFLCELTNAPPIWRLLRGEMGVGTPIDTVEERLRERPVPHHDALQALAARRKFERELREQHKEETEKLDKTLVAGARSGYSNAGPDLVEKARRLEHEAMVAKREKEEEARYLRQVADIRKAVREQAGPVEGQGWLTLRNREKNKAWRVPAAPFMYWSLVRRLPEVARALEWQTVSPPGMKLMMDLPQHTDWLLGGMELSDGGSRDLSLETDYRGNDAADLLAATAYDRAFDIERLETAKICGLDTGFHVLSIGACAVRGVVVHPEEDVEVPVGSVAIVPDASPRWAIAVMSAAAVIVEVGGELAHIVQVGRERNIPVYRVPDALDRWAPGTILMLDPDCGKIEVVTSVEWMR
jgi:hypothetical protein